MSPEEFRFGEDNVILIGMPGAGKSTLGVVMAKIMGYGFLDGDLLIQDAEDTLLQRIIDERGTEEFLVVEDRVLSAIEAKRAVISTGGSAVYSAAAMEHLRSIGVVVYLQIGFEELKRRLSDFSERGVVMRDGIGMSLRDLYEERLPLYRQYADITVNVDDLSITAAARKAVDALK